jgi:hypothetical protein
VKPSITCALVLALCWSACACSSDDDTPLQCGDRACPSECRELSGDSCDVLDERCRKRILAALVCVRGTPGDLPEIDVLTEDELRDELNEQAMLDAGTRAAPGSASDEDAGGLDAGVAPAGTALGPWSVALALLGLLPPDTDVRAANADDGAQSIAGYYRSAEHRIILIDRGEPQDDWDADSLFAHELDHALQDQVFGLQELGERGPRAPDGSFARASLIEGEASLYGAMTTALLQGITFDRATFEIIDRASLKYGRREVVASPAPYSALWHLHYAIGATYLFDAFRDGGNWAVQRTFEQPPTSTIHLMIGYEQNTSRREPLVLPLACDQAAAPDGYHSYDSASMGATMLFAFLGRALRRDDGVFESEAQWQNALHWRQDRFTVFHDDAEQVAVSYRIRFDDARTAKRIGAELTDHAGLPLRVRVHGDELELLAAEGDVPDSWETDPASCPAAAP